VEAIMTVKGLKILLAATALGVGALAYSGPADARVRGRAHHGWHYGWHKGWYRDSVVASDYDVAPRRAHRRGCAVASYDDDFVVASDYDVAPRRARYEVFVAASDYVAPPAYDFGYHEPAYYAAPVVYAAPLVYTAPVVYTVPVVYAVPETYSPGWWGSGYGWPF
jgi:hypothetical protein